jgi:hypothetical protein
MDRNDLHGFDAPQFRYSRVERSLASVFGLDVDRQSGALRGRLKHLQRLGLPGLEAGKGIRLQYSQEQASQWLMALLMAQIGIDPVVIVQAIKSNWKSLVPSVKEATDGRAKRGSHIFLGLQPRLMSGAWGDGPNLQIIMFRRYVYSVSSAVDDSAEAIDELLRYGDWLCLVDFTFHAFRLEMTLR